MKRSASSVRGGGGLMTRALRSLEDCGNKAVNQSCFNATVFIRVMFETRTRFARLVRGDVGSCRTNVAEERLVDGRLRKQDKIQSFSELCKLLILNNPND